MERILDFQIEKLKTRLVKMCSLVDEQVDLAIKAVLENNHDLANIVIENDKIVDKYDVKIEKLCQKIFALNQPVAMDLRLIMSALTIDNNMERIGDLAVNLAEAVLFIKEKQKFFDQTKLVEMTILAREMLKDAIDSFIEGNAKLAEKVIQSDKQLDQMHYDNHQMLVKIMKESPDNIEPAVTYLVISRHLERMGDHATNVAEDVIFIVEAQLVKHQYEKYFFSQQESADGTEPADEDI